MFAKKMAVLTFSLILASVILLVMAFIPLLFMHTSDGTFFRQLAADIPLLLIFIGSVGLGSLIVVSLLIGFALRHPFNPINSLADFFSRLHRPSGVGGALSAFSLGSFFLIYAGIIWIIIRYFALPLISTLLIDIPYYLALAGILVTFLWIALLIAAPSWNGLAKLFGKLTRSK